MVFMTDIFSSPLRDLEVSKNTSDQNMHLARSAAHIQFVQPTTTTDQQCKTIIDRHLSGELPGPLARRLIADELHRSNVATEVGMEGNIYSLHLRDEVVAEMQSLLLQKVLQDTPGGFNMELAAGSSVVGWARKLLWAARPSILRNVTNRTIKKTVSVSPIAIGTPEETSVSGYSWAYSMFHQASAATSAAPVTDLGCRNDMEIASEWLRSKGRYLRDSSRRAARAASLMHGYSVPALIRPRPAERTRLIALLTADPTLAHRSVKAMTAAVETGSMPDPIDQGLLALWDDYSFAHLQDISSADTKVASVLVEDILADRAHPHRVTLRAFRAAVRAMGTGTGWTKLAEECCAAFVAQEFEACSPFDSTAETFREEREAGRIIACRKAPEVFARVLLHPGQKFSRSASDLYEHLDRIITDLTAFDVKDPDLAA